MRYDTRVIALASILSVALACGGAGNQTGSTPPEGSGAAPGSASAPSGASGSGSASTTPGGSASPSGAAAPAPAPMPPMPMDVASGTELVLRLDTPVSSETAKVEQVVRATVAESIVVGGMTVIPEGAPVTGVVVAAERSGRVKGRASIALRFNEVEVANTPYRISTSRIVREAEATKGEDAKKIGIGAGVGTAIGAIAGGKKGAAIGAAVGGGAGTGAVLATRGKEVSLPKGATLRTTIQETVRIMMPMS